MNTKLLAPVLLAGSVAAQSSAYTFYGDDSLDYFGQAVQACGDVDGDSVPDVLVGVIGDDNTAFYAGAVRVYSGADGALIYERCGDFQGDRLARSVGGPGDLDGDGRAEFVAGAANSDVNGPCAGMVRVYDGSDGSIRFEFLGDGDHDELGWSVNGAGDVDDDGVADVIAGARQVFASTTVGPGYARVFSGATGQELWTFWGDTQADQFGFSVDGAGDVDGDGFDDLVVGAPYADANGVDSGYARVLSGFDGQTLFTWIGANAGDRFGYAVNGGLDVDGDSFPDVVVGGPDGALGPDRPGVARVYSGFDGSPIHTLYGDAHGDGFGQSVAVVGNLDGAGNADLLIGAHADDDNGKGSGSIRAFAGSTAQVLFDLHGDQQGDLLGYAVDTLGDLNGDAYDDVIGGAWNASTATTTSSGYVRVFLSAAPPPMTYCTAKIDSQGCVGAIASSGAPSLSIGDDLVVSATGVQNQKPGLAFWGLGPVAAPFLGGTLCVSPPLVRTTVQLSSGSAPPTVDCSGSFAFPFTSSYEQATGLLPGDALHVQYWSRDPAHPDGTGVALSDAVHIDLVP